jgi:type II secretory pathway component GspD/PulD (secretin)
MSSSFKSKWKLSLLILAFSSVAVASKTMNMNFRNEELTKIIDNYSKATGQKFIVDPSVRGKVSIFVQEPVSLEEAFNKLSSALALQGFAISKQGDTMIIKSARSMTRDLIEVGTSAPNHYPERLYTWIYTPQHLPAEAVVNELRVLSSRDGEISVYQRTNQLVISDWTSNHQRIAAILKEIDKPVDPKLEKVIDAGKKLRQERTKSCNCGSKSTSQD